MGFPLIGIHHHLVSHDKHMILKALVISNYSNKTSSKPIALPSTSSLGFDIV